MVLVNSWELYEARLLHKGQTERERVVARERATLTRKGRDSVALKEVEVHGVTQSLFIHATDVSSEKTFNTLPGETVELGDVIFWNKMHWLVTNVDFDDEITRNGRIQQCNRQIRWQNPKTGQIIERWCLATKPYTSNIHEGMVVANSNREYKVQIGFDEETILVGLNRRFLLEQIDNEPKAYEVVSVDTITNRYEDAGGGFLVWNLSQHEYNPATDNAELMIADYVESGAQPVVPSDEALWCRIDGDTQVRCGTHRRYKALFFTQDGVAGTDAQAVWSVEAPTDAVTWSISDDGLILTLNVPDGSDVGDIIKIALSDANNTYVSTTLEVEVIPFL